MTREEALFILKDHDRVGCNLIQANDEETTKFNNDSQTALAMAIQALEERKTGYLTDVLKKIRDKIENIDDWEVVNGAVYVRDFYVKEIIDEAIWEQKA